MNFLIDSANVDEVRKAMEFSFVNGVTTNPREVAYQAKGKLSSYLQEMRKAARGIIHIQVISPETRGMVKEAHAICNLAKGVRIKIPVTPAGLKATEILSKEKIEVAATAVNTVTMAILAAKSGAKSVISYYGVLEDFEEDAGDLLKDTTEAFQKYGLETEVVFFARNVKQVRKGIRAGANGCLMTLAGLNSLFDHPLTKREVDFMLATWRKRFGEKTWDV